MWKNPNLFLQIFVHGESELNSSQTLNNHTPAVLQNNRLYIQNFLINLKNKLSFFMRNWFD
jgi:hypothetical protein